MLQFSKSTEYSLRAVIYLAKYSSFEKRFFTKSIAQALNFPEAYLAKVLQHLVKKKLIHSIKGPNGGFYTNGDILNTSLLSIIEVCEGIESFSSCGMGLHECSDSKPCTIHNDYKSIRDNYYHLLSDKTINQVIEDLDNETAFINSL